MARVPSRIAGRITSGIKKFQPILNSAKKRDLGESDTVTIVVDMLSEIFGYDKYSEITSEHCIRGTYCDLATKLDGEIRMLFEVKAIGLDLKDIHTKQAIDYAANEGIDWVTLTNGMFWKVYKVAFTKPIDKELVLELDFSQLNSRTSKDVESLFLFCKEGWSKSVLGEYHSQKQALNRFFLGSIILSESCLQLIRRELRRQSPDVKVDTDEIKEVLTSEVLKRDVVEGDKAEEARKKVARASSKSLRTRRVKKSSTTMESPSNGTESEASASTVALKDGKSPLGG